MSFGVWPAMKVAKSAARGDSALVPAKRMKLCTLGVGKAFSVTDVMTPKVDPPPWCGQPCCPRV